MAYLLFIYNKTDKRNQRFQDFSQNSRIYKTQLQFVNVFFGHPLTITTWLSIYLCLFHLPISLFISYFISLHSSSSSYFSFSLILSPSLFFWPSLFLSPGADQERVIFEGGGGTLCFPHYFVLSQT